MIHFLSLIPSIVTLIILGYGTTTQNSASLSGYNLASPDTVVVLPEVLHEISGITVIDSTTFVCIQDEKGILFLYSTIKNTINEQFTFAIDGDYEGIARVDRAIYVLRSDGALFEISDFKSNNSTLTSYATGIPANNNEGLCYDPDNRRLLIASKGKVGKGAENKDKRVIYGFELNTKKLTEEPLFDFDLQVIKQFAINNKVNITARKKRNGQIADPNIKFRTSAICIHPITKKLYLLSASDHLLFIFNMNGSIEHIEPLDPVMFNKAEGIAFFENGDMLITNEGQDRKPTLLKFKYKP